jgi:hypothetical protein
LLQGDRVAQRASKQQHCDEEHAGSAARVMLAVAFCVEKDFVGMTNSRNTPATES